MMHADQIAAAFAAAECGDLAVLAQYLDDGGQVDQKNEYGWTLLITAVNSRQIDAANLLIDRGASLKTRDNVGFTAEDHAINARIFDLPEKMQERNRLSAA